MVKGFGCSHALFCWRNYCDSCGVGQLKYNIALIVANLLFGISFSFYVSLVESGITFQQIFMLQVVVGALCFVPFSIASSRSYKITVEDFGTIFIVALIVIYGWLYMLLWGASQTSPIDASMIATLGPVFTLFVAHILSPQPISWIKTIGAFVAIAGALALITDKNHNLLATTQGAFGNVLVLCAVVAIASNTVLIHSQLRRYGAMTVIGWYYLIGLVMTVPFFWGELKHLVEGWHSIVVIGELFYVTLLGMVLPMWLLYVGAENLTAVHTALYRYIQPAIATVLAIVRGQNRLDRANIIGAVLIFSGVVFVVAGNIISRRVLSTTKRKAT